MEHIFETVVSTLYLNVMNTKIITFMIPFTYAMGYYDNTVVYKYKYVCLLSAIAAISFTLWAYIFLPVPPESRTLLVGSYVFLINFLAAMFWGSATWLVYRYFRRRKLARQMPDEADAA